MVFLLPYLVGGPGNLDGASVEHIIPKSRDRANRFDTGNMVLAHLGCNRKRRLKMLTPLFRPCESARTE